MQKPTQNKTWRGKTGGTKGMQETLIRMFRHIDTRVVAPFVVCWVLGYLLGMRAERRASWHYWRRHQGARPLAACVAVWRQFYAMSHVVLDRFAAYAGQNFQILTDDPAGVMGRLQHSEKGFVILSSHVGNQELAGYFTHSEKPLHILIYLGDTPTVNRERERLFEANKLQFLPMEADGSHIFEMHQVLGRGEALSIHGDRLFSDSRSLKTAFLGAEAAFPEGPFRVAALERVPVVTMFMLRTGHKRYELRIRELSRPVDETLNNKQLAQALLSRYAHEMELALADYPEQWFNFFEFWTEEPAERQLHNGTVEIQADGKKATEQI